MKAAAILLVLAVIGRAHAARHLNDNTHVNDNTASVFPKASTSAMAKDAAPKLPAKVVVVQKLQPPPVGVIVKKKPPPLECTGIVEKVCCHMQPTGYGSHGKAEMPKICKVIIAVKQPKKLEEVSYSMDDSYSEDDNYSSGMAWKSPKGVVCVCPAKKKAKAYPSTSTSTPLSHPTYMPPSSGR